MKVGIIGSGLAGLTAGAYMARDQHDVTIYEQFSDIGGVAATLQQEGYGWDLGPLLIEGIGPNEPAGDVLAELGLANRIKLIQQDRGLAFPDFDLWKPEEYAGPYWRREKLKKLFPAEAKGLDSYYEFYDRIMDMMALFGKVEKQSGLPKLINKLRLLSAFRKVKHMQDWSAAQVMTHFFKEEKIKAVYTAILADFVVLPSQFQGLAIPAVNVENAFDKRIPRNLSKAGPRPAYHYVAGGCGTLVAAMADMIRSNGGTILINTPVKRIAVESGRVEGVVTGDDVLNKCDLVIASGGAKECFLDMVGREYLTPEYTRLVEDIPLMESVFMVHLGIDFDPSPYQRAELCYYIGAYDVEKGVNHCKDGVYHEGEDGFLIYVPSLHSPDMAPAGHQALTIYTIAPNKAKQGNWTDLKDEMSDKLLRCAENIIPGLREHATVRVVLTPDDFKARTHLKHHSFGGCSPVMGRPGMPHKTPVENLWFVGAQSEGMGGVGNVISKTANVVKTIKRPRRG